MLVKFEQNHRVQTTQNFELLGKKSDFFITVFDKELNTILEDVSVAEIIV